MAYRLLLPFTFVSVLAIAHSSVSARQSRLTVLFNPPSPASTFRTSD